MFRQIERASTFPVRSSDENFVVTMARPVFNFQHGDAKWYMDFVPGDLHWGFPMLYWIDSEVSERREGDPHKELSVFNVAHHQLGQARHIDGGCVCRRRMNMELDQLEGFEVRSGLEELEDVDIHRAFQRERCQRGDGRHLPSKALLGSEGLQLRSLIILVWDRRVPVVHP